MYTPIWCVDNIELEGEMYMSKKYKVFAVHPQISVEDAKDIMLEDPEILTACGGEVATKGIRGEYLSTILHIPEYDEDDTFTQGIECLEDHMESVGLEVDFLDEMYVESGNRVSFMHGQYNGQGCVIEVIYLAPEVEYSIGG